MDIDELIGHWQFRTHRVQLAHYECARRLEHMHLFLGIPAVVLSTLVGTAVFASISQNTSIWLQIFVGLISVAAAVLSAMQTFLGNAELAERHRLAGARFANLKHRIELLQTMPPASATELRDSLTDIETTWSTMREESPSLPGSVWRRIESSVKYGVPMYPSN